MDIPTVILFLDTAPGFWNDILLAHSIGHITDIIDRPATISGNSPVLLFADAYSSLSEAVHVLSFERSSDLCSPRHHRTSVRCDL